MRRLVFAVLLFALSGAVLGQGTVHEYQLENGMQVIIKEDHRAPIVVSQVWYRVGSSYEPDGITGISHALEHMMFKGTEKYQPGEFSRIVAANGGEENAFTGKDYTAYYETLSRDRLEVAFELEADRMRNLLLPADEFAKEIEVVKEERRWRTEDNPTSLTYEQFNAVAYRALPYQHPVVGWMSDLEQMTVQDLREWYRLWYAPNNATLVVVGDVQPESVLVLAKKYFDPLKAEPTPKTKRLLEPPQRGAIRTTVRAPARQPYLILGYKTPVIGTPGIEEWEPYALEMLAAILDGGNSARFSRNLVRGKEIAVSASAEYSAVSRLPEMLIMGGVPRDGHSVQELEAALKSEGERLKTELVSEEELDRVRAQAVAGEVFQLDSVFNQATQIGMLETFGLDWRLIDQYVANLEKVTAEQVREVARKYLLEEHLTVAVLDPLPIEQKQSGTAPAGGRHEQ